MYLPAVSAIGALPSLTLQEKFHMHVMCNYTPKHPNNQLFYLFEQYAPMTEVWHMGSGNLKQLITEWYKSHPAFAGLKVDAWCKRLRETQPSKSVVFKFCFKYTPGYM